MCSSFLPPSSSREGRRRRTHGARILLIMIQLLYGDKNLFYLLLPNNVRVLCYQPSNCFFIAISDGIQHRLNWWLFSILALALNEMKQCFHFNLLIMSLWSYVSHIRPSVAERSNDRSFAEYSPPLFSVWRLREADQRRGTGGPAMQVLLRPARN